jgi:hypothetical protein
MKDINTLVDLEVLQEALVDNAPDLSLSPTASITISSAALDPSSNVTLSSNTVDSSDASSMSLRSVMME